MARFDRGKTLFQFISLREPATFTLNAVLTEISLGWPNNSLVGETAFPSSGCLGSSLDKYYVFGREAWFARVGDYRAPGTEANEIPGFEAFLWTRTMLRSTRYRFLFTDEERENVDSPLSPDRDGTELLTSKNSS